MTTTTQAKASLPNAFAIPARSVAHNHRYTRPVERSASSQIRVVGREVTQAENVRRFGMRWASI